MDQDTLQVCRLTARLFQKCRSTQAANRQMFVRSEQANQRLFAELRQIRQECSQIRSQMREMKGSIDQLFCLHSEAKKEITDIKKDLSRLQNGYQKQYKQIQELNQDHKQMKEQYCDWRRHSEARQKDIQQQLSSMNQSIRELRGQLRTQMDRAGRQAKSQAEKLQAQLNSAKRVIFNFMIFLADILQDSQDHNIRQLDLVDNSQNQVNVVILQSLNEIFDKLRKIEADSEGLREKQLQLQEAIGQFHRRLIQFTKQKDRDFDRLMNKFEAIEERINTQGTFFDERVKSLEQRIQI